MGGDFSIQKAAKSVGIRWEGHGVEVPDSSPAKIVFARSPDGTRRDGAPQFPTRYTPVAAAKFCARCIGVSRIFS